MEYIDAQESSIATIPNDERSVSDMRQTSLFDFHAEHNGEACIASLDPKDRGTERRFRFTRALLCTLLGVKSEDTITNHVDKLLKRGVIDNTKNLVLLKSEHGRETTLYNLNVLNQLAMVEMKNKVLNETAKKFSDILSETYQIIQFPSWAASPNALQRETSGTVMRTALV